MKKLCSIILVLFFVFFLCGAAAPQASYSVTGTNMVLRFPDDYVIYGQDGALSGNGGVMDWDKEEVDSLLDYMKENRILLYATQIDEYDEIYVDSASFAATRSMQDFTKFYENHSEMDDKELLSKLEEATYLRGPESVVENYTSKSMEVVTINGEKYGYAVGVFENEFEERYVLEYDTVKNGKAIRLEMYTTGEPHEDQINAFRGIMETIGYTRGANGFLSQYILGTNGAALLPWIILGVCVIAAIVVLIVLLRIRRKKHPKIKGTAYEPQGGPYSPLPQYPPSLSTYEKSAPPQEQAAPHVYERPTPPQEQAPPPVYERPTPPQEQAPPPMYERPTPPQEQAPPPMYERPTPPQEQAPPPTYERPAPPQEQAAPSVYERPASPQEQVTPPVYGKPAPPQERTTTPGEADVVKLLETLAELKRQGVLSPEEYEYKKNELLRRL